MLRRQLRVIGQRQFAPAFEALRFQWQNHKMRHQRGKLLDLQRLTKHRLQLTQGCVLIIVRLDFFSHRHAQARLGFQHIGASTLTAFKKPLVELQALGKGALLRPAQFDPLLRQQRLAVGTEHAHRQILAFAAKALIRKQRLRCTLSESCVGFVVQQRLLQGQGRRITAVVAVGPSAGLGDFGLVARIVVVPRQGGQQRRATQGAVLLPCRPLFNGGMEGRVVANRQIVGFQQPHRLYRPSTRHQ